MPEHVLVLNGPEIANKPMRLVKKSKRYFKRSMKRQVKRATNLGHAIAAHMPTVWFESQDASSSRPLARQCDQEDLRKAERDVATLEGLVADWREIVALRNAEGREALHAGRILQKFENDLAGHRACRDAIKQRLAENREPH